MVSEAEIAEARRKALRNGEEDPVAVAQRYLNVYRQMHIFTPEKKSEFDQSLLNLSPISIGIISSLPGGLTFQDYIDEIMTNAGREKVSKTNKEIDVPETLPQTNMPDSNQPIVQPQPIAVPVMSGQAKVSIDTDFAGEFAKIMGVSKQCVSNWENDNIMPSIEMLVKIADFFNVTTDHVLGRDERTEEAHQGPASGQVQTEAVQALVALGYSNAEALRAVKKVAITDATTVEDVLKQALKNMMF